MKEVEIKKDLLRNEWRFFSEHSRISIDKEGWIIPGTDIILRESHYNPHIAPDYHPDHKNERITTIF
jgi:hypothetical protein